MIEQIDIGGPALVRAAAKNHANVAVVTSVAQYDGVVAALEAGGTTLAERRALAAAAFGRIADYDLAIANWFARRRTPDEGGCRLDRRGRLPVRRHAAPLRRERPPVGVALARAGRAAGSRRPSSCTAAR